MKLPALICMLSISLISIGQNSPIDFEPTGFGGDWTWTTFENDDNPALDVVTNPVSGGINTSSTVAKFTSRKAGQPWAGCESKHGEDIGVFTLDANTSTITIMVYKPVISDVGIKLVEASSASLGEIKVANTKINEWEKLTFDLSTREGIAYDQIVIFIDFKDRDQDNVCYFDNVIFGNKTGEPKKEPKVPAPDPTADAADVISLFSNVYSDVPVNSWRTDWSGGNLSEIEIKGNDTKHYSSLNFVGIETVGENLLDVSSMGYFNIDVWSANVTEFRVKLVDFGVDKVFGGGDDSEHEVAINPFVQEQWNSFHLALSDFTSLAANTNIAQLIISADPSGAGDVYVDNVFFSKDVVSIEPVNDISFTLYPNPSSDVVRISGLGVADEKTIVITNSIGQIVSEERVVAPDVSILVSNFIAGLYFVDVIKGGVRSTQKLMIY